MLSIVRVHGAGKQRHKRRGHRAERRPHHHQTNGRTPLSAIDAGETVSLIEIQGGRKLRKRFADLGLNVGMSIRVVQNAHSGPLILAVKDDTRLAIGRGMAGKICVSMESNDTD